MKLSNLSRPFFVLAPMDDVTDTVFRQVVADCSPPDLFFTEFVNVYALQSKGREATLPRLQFTQKEKPIIAQLWGLDPENFYKSAKEISQMGYDGVDLNFGCPDKNVVRNGACSAFILPENRSRAVEIIKATQEGARATHVDAAQGGDEERNEAYGRYDEMSTAVSNAAQGHKPQRVSGFATKQAGAVRSSGRAGEIIKAPKEGSASLPVSAKTRLGFSEIDYSWHELLLKQKLNMLTIHGRTKSQMSKVPADWDAIGHIARLSKKLSPTTLIIGNGDIMTRQQGENLAEQHGLDGIMIGRGIFHDPYVFAQNSPWPSMTKEQRLALYKKHVELFNKTWQKNERKIYTLNKFCKIYINGFDGAKELREKLMAANSPDELLDLLSIKLV